jgi:hypothetical protein
MLELWQSPSGVFFGDEWDEAVFEKYIINADCACDPFKTFVITHFDGLSDVAKSYELFLLRSCKVARQLIVVENSQGAQPESYTV